MRRIIRILTRIVLSLLLLLVLLWVLIQLPPVQTAIIRFIGERFEAKTGYRLDAGQVDLRFPVAFVFRDLAITESTGDSLLVLDKLVLNAVEADLNTLRFSAYKLDLDRPNFQLRIQQGDSLSNLDRLIKNFQSTSSDGPIDFGVELTDLRIRNGSFSFHNYNKEALEKGADFNHLNLSGIHAHIREIALVNEDLDASIDELRFASASGLVLEKLDGDFLMRSDSLSLENYHLKTKESLLEGNLLFTFDRWAAFSHFNTEVQMKGELIASTIDFDDLAQFTNELDHIGRQVRFDGRFRGSVSDLKVRDFIIGLDEHTWIEGKLDMIGLPDFSSTFIDLNVSRMETLKSELDRIPIPPFDEKKLLETPDNFAALGKLGFSGKFTGFPSDFVAFGTLNTAIGSIKTDLKLQEQDKDYTYSGSLNTKNFDLGKFYNSKDLGRLTSRLRLQGKGLTQEHLNAEIRGSVDAITLRGYTYKDLTTNGTFRQDFFEGDLTLHDDNIDLDFSGLIDFTGAKPRFDFTTSIAHLDLIQLNLLDMENYTSLSGDFRIEAEGIKLDEIQGRIQGSNMRFCTSSAEYPIDRLVLTMEQNDQIGKRFMLDSEIASGRLEGKFDFTGLGSGLKQILADIIPQYEAPSAHNRGKEDFYLELDLHHFELVSQVFLPELDIAPKARFTLLMDDRSGDFKTTFTSDRISYEQYQLDSLVLDISHPDQSLYANLTSTRADLGGGLVFPNLGIDNYTERDTIYTNLIWGEESSLVRGEAAVMSFLRGSKQLTTRLNLLNLMVSGEQWSLQQMAEFHLDSTRMEMDAFFLARGAEHLRIDGAISEDPTESLLVEMQGVKLSMFDAFLEGAGITQRGILTGNLELRDMYKRSLVSSDLLALDYHINDYRVGDICVESSWDATQKRMLIAGELERDKLKQLKFSGFYFPENDEQQLDILCSVDDLPLELVNAFVDEGVSDISGLMDGRIEITGRIAEPQFAGEVTMKEASAHVEYLNTTYYLNDKASIDPDMFAFNFPIRDEEDNEAYLVGTVLHENFSEWNFDIFLDMDRGPFLCLNTTSEENSLYFGKAYATGYTNISGTADDIRIDVNAKVERGTSIALPLSDSEEVTFEDFVSFIDRSKENIDDQKVDLSGISMNFELDITPDAQFRIIFDEVVGDEIKGRGSGHIRMEIDQLNNFNMFGNVTIEQGRYLFTLKNLINKEFEVNPGGTISWFGDPLVADIDIEAVYRVNTSLYELFPGESEQYKQRVPVNLQMNLDGKLMNPSIEFEIKLPNSDELTKARVASVINTTQDINQQAFSLLVLRRFISPPDIAKTNTNIGLAENSTELITSQLSNWLSQISDDFDIGVNYSPGDQISNEELAVALSTQLFNDRLLISGNFGVSQTRQQAANDNPNNLIGDIRVEYKIHPKGKIRLIVYNESNEFDLARSRQNSYTQGMGVIFQEEFNSLYELFGLRDPEQ